MSNIDVHEFITALDSCKGDVWLFTDEGDKLISKVNSARLLVFSNSSKAVNW